MTTINFPPGAITPQGARKLLEGDEPMVGYRSGNEVLNFDLMGAKAPVPGVQSGVTLKSIKGLIAIWQTKDQQGANQDGVTFTGAVYDPIVVDMECEVHGLSPQDTRLVVRRWIESWDVEVQGELWCLCESGYWYAPVRWFKTPTDKLMRATSNRQPFLWTARADDGFWRSIDSVCEFKPGAGTHAGFITLTNIGDQKGWINHVVYGPFDSVEIANGPSSSSMIKFGPLLENQIALLRTEPRRRGVYDITITPPPGQVLNIWQQFLKGLISLAVNGNIPQLLRQFESFFGIDPPQGELYSLLNGRFTNPIPPKPAGGLPVESHIAVKIIGGNANSKIESYVTPRRRYPF